MSIALELLGLACLAVAGFALAPWVGFGILGAALLFVARGLNG